METLQSEEKTESESLSEQKSEPESDTVQEQESKLTTEQETESETTTLQESETEITALQESEPEMTDEKTDLSDCEILLSQKNFYYNGSYQTPEITVLHDGTKLQADTDYVVSYSDNKKAGTASVTITAAKDSETFTGSQTVTFDILALETPLITQTTILKNGIRLQWEAVEGAQLYRVYRKTGGSKWQLLGAVTDTSFCDLDVVSGTEYCYTIRCANAANTILTSSYDKNGTSVTFAGTPAVLKLDLKANGIKVTWEAVDGYSSYRLYRKNISDASAEWERVANVQGTTYLDTAVASGNIYCYAVKCLNSEKKIFTSGYKSSQKILYCAAPQNSTLAIKSTGVKLSWDAVTGAESYRVYRKAEGEAKWTIIAHTSKTNFTDTNVTAGVKYTYTVRCENASGSKCTSYYQSTPSITYVINAEMKSAVNTLSGVKLSWKKAAGAASYKVFRKAEGEEDWTKLGAVKTTSFTDTTAKSGVNYVYAIQTISADSRSYLGDKTTGFAAVFYAAPTVTVNLYSAGLKVSWDAVENAVAYRVYRRTSSQGKWLVVGETSKNYFKDTTANTSKLNIYTVRCIDASGNTVSSYYQNCAVYVPSSYTGFVLAGENWTYYVDGIAEDVTNVIKGTVNKQTAWWYVQNGIVDLTKDGSFTYGIRQYFIEQGVAISCNYYFIEDEISLPSAGYDLTTNNIGLKVMKVNQMLLGSSSGYYTTATANAVYSFQASHGLAATGVVDLTTWLALGYSEYDWYYLGAYVTPMKVDGMSSREERISAMLQTASEYAAAGTSYNDGCSGTPGTYVDCSGLIFQCLYSAGINPDVNIINHAELLYEYSSRWLSEDNKLGLSVSTDSLQPGDLLFYASNGKTTVIHTAIYAGNGMIYDSYPGYGVTYRSVNISGLYITKATRVF